MMFWIMETYLSIKHAKCHPTRWKWSSGQWLKGYFFGGTLVKN